MTLIFRTKRNRYEVGSPKKEKWKKRKTEVQFDKIILNKKIRSFKMEVFGPEIPELELGS